MSELPKTKSYIALLAKARELFMKYGMKRVTVEEICTEAAVSKMSFYRNFSNKQAIAKTVLIELLDEGKRDYEAIFDSLTSFPEKMEQLLVMKSKKSAAVSQEFIMDVMKLQDETLFKPLIEQKEWMEKRVAADMQKAKDKGWIREEIKVSFILYMITDLRKKMIDPEMIALYPTVEERSKALNSFFFHGILNEKRNG